MTDITDSKVTYTGNGVYEIVVDGEWFREETARITAEGSTNAAVEASSVIASAVLQAKHMVTRSPYMHFLSHGDPTGETVEIRVES